MVAEQDIGTPYSGFGRIPDEIVMILGSVMAEKYYKALESGSRKGITDDEWTVLTGLRANYGTFNFQNPTFVGMLEPLSTMGVNEIAVELNTRQKNIPAFGTPEYSEWLRLNPKPPLGQPGDEPTGGSIGAGIGAVAGPAITTAYEGIEGEGTVTTEPDPSSLASLEFGVGGPGAGRPVTETVEGGFGRQPASTTGGGGVAPPPVEETPPVPVDWQTAAQEMYPEYYAIVKNHPEIAELLKKAIGPPEYSEARFAAELRATNWYQTTTAAARTWDTASQLDPATYQAKVDQAATDIQTEALNLGIRLSDATVQKLALDSQRLGWGSQMITNAIGMAATEGGSEGATQLREGYYGQQVRSLAGQYGVTLADTTFNSFINKLAVGEETLGSFQDYAMTIGKSLYPSLSDQFDAGRTFEDVTSGYKNIAANILERDSNSIDMSSPEFVQAITYAPDPKTGEQRLMNMAEWGDYLRKTESLGYQNTTEARSRAYEVSNKIANMFGRV